MNQIMKEIANIWEYKVGINAIIASFVCVWKCQVSCLPNCANSHCLKDWDFKDPYVVMLCWFQLKSQVQKSIDAKTNVKL